MKRKEGESEREQTSSLCLHVHKLRAVNFLPFHGRQPGPVKRRRRRREERPRGAEVSLKDELSLTHTHLLFFSPTHSFSPSSFTHTLSLPSLSRLTPNFSSQFVSFCSFTFTHTHTHSHAILPDEGRPPGVPESGGAYVSQGALLWDYEGRGLGAQSPILHFLSFRKGRAGNSLGKKEKKESPDHANQGQRS